MLQKTKGIVLRFTRYRETSIITNIFTEQFGMQSYVVNSVRVGSVKSEMALFQPLTLLDLVVYHRDQGNVMRIKEKRCLYIYRDLMTNTHKAAVALFIDELLLRTLREESHPQGLYVFVEESLISLDRAEAGVENFHLYFMLSLAAHLGFAISSTEELLEGLAVSGEEQTVADEFLKHMPGGMLDISNQQRRWLLDLLVAFYSRHIHHLGEMKSVQVLRDVLV